MPLLPLLRPGAAAELAILLRQSLPLNSPPPPPYRCRRAQAAGVGPQAAIYDLIADLVDDAPSIPDKGDVDLISDPVRACARPPRLARNRQLRRGPAWQRGGAAGAAAPAAGASKHLHALRTTEV